MGLKKKKVSKNTNCPYANKSVQIYSFSGLLTDKVYNDEVLHGLTLYFMD